MLCNFYYWVSLIGGSDHFQMQSVVEYNLHVKFVSCTPLDYKKSSLIYCFRNRPNSKIERIATHTRKRTVRPQNLSSTNTVLIFLFKILKIFPMQIKNAVCLVSICSKSNQITFAKNSTGTKIAVIYTGDMSPPLINTKWHPWPQTTDALFALCNTWNVVSKNAFI